MIPHQGKAPMVYGRYIELAHGFINQQRSLGGTTLQTHYIPIISHDTPGISWDFPMNIPFIIPLYPTNI